MAPLTWRNVDAPDLSAAGRMIEGAGQNWGKAFSGLGDNLSGLRETQKNNLSADALAMLGGVGSEADLAGVMSQIQGQMRPQDMSPELLASIQGAGRNALGMDAERKRMSLMDAQIAATGRSNRGGGGGGSAQGKTMLRQQDLANLSAMFGGGAPVDGAPQQATADQGQGQAPFPRVSTSGGKPMLVTPTAENAASINQAQAPVSAPQSAPAQAPAPTNSVQAMMEQAVSSNEPSDFGGLGNSPENVPSTLEMMQFAPNTDSRDIARMRDEALKASQDSFENTTFSSVLDAVRKYSDEDLNVDELLLRAVESPDVTAEEVREIQDNMDYVAPMLAARTARNADTRRTATTEAAQGKLFEALGAGVDPGSLEFTDRDVQDLLSNDEDIGLMTGNIAERAGEIAQGDLSRSSVRGDGDEWMETFQSARTIIDSDAEVNSIYESIASNSVGQVFRSLADVPEGDLPAVFAAGLDLRGASEKPARAQSFALVNEIMAEAQIDMGSAMQLVLMGVVPGDPEVKRGIGRFAKDATLTAPSMEGVKGVLGRNGLTLEDIGSPSGRRKLAAVLQDEALLTREQEAERARYQQGEDLLSRYTNATATLDYFDSQGPVDTSTEKGRAIASMMENARNTQAEAQTGLAQWTRERMEVANINAGGLSSADEAAQLAADVEAQRRADNAGQRPGWSDPVTDNEAQGFSVGGEDVPGIDKDASLAVRAAARKGDAVSIRLALREIARSVGPDGGWAIARGIGNIGDMFAPESEVSDRRAERDRGEKISKYFKGERAQNLFMQHKDLLGEVERLGPHQFYDLYQPVIENDISADEFKRMMRENAPPDIPNREAPSSVMSPIDRMMSQY